MRTVAIIMGSDSDLGVMQKAIDKLKALQIEFEVRILSAHRTPEASAQFLVSTFDEDLLGRLLAGRFDLDINYKALSAENIALCHENGITVNAWTVDDKEAAEQLAAWGVDMITSNILE